MKYFSRMNRPTTKPSPIGDGTQPIYEERLNEDGKLVLVESGEDNLFEFVQASKAECDIYHILERYQRGDVDVLNRRAGQYLDVVGLPTNLMDMHNTMVNVQRQFDALDPEIRQKFDNDVNVFVATVAQSTPEQLRAIFGVTNSDVSDVKDGDGDVA